MSATLREQTALDAPASITVVNGAEIRARGYRTLKEIMNDVPGFGDVADTNEEIVAVRGVFTSTTNKILILVNGHRMNDLMLGRYNTDQYLGMRAVERVEFIRGPASALYGTGALVGVVNVITRKGADLGGGEACVQAGPAARQASVSWGRELGGYDVFFNYTLLDAVGQTLAQPAALDRPPPGQAPAPGEIYLGRYRENMSGLFTLRSDTAALTLRAAHFRRVPPRAAFGSFYDYQGEPFRPAYTENDFLVDFSQTLVLDGAGRTRLTFNPSVHFFSYFEQSFLSYGANRVPPLGQRGGMQGEFNNYQMKLTLEQQTWPSLNLIAGLDGLLASFQRSDAVTSTGERVVLIPQGYSSLGRWFLGGAFLQAVWSPRPALGLTLGLRYDTFEDEADPELTPRLGLVYKPHHNLALKLLYGRSYLAPMWAHERANDGAFVGTPGLRPETFEGLDLVLAYGRGRSMVTVDLFYNRIQGLINGVLEPGSNVFVYVNQGHSVYLGLEVATDLLLLPWLRLTGSYAYLRPDGRPWRTSPGLLVDGRIKEVPHHTLRYGLRLDPAPAWSASLWGRTYGQTATSDPATGRARLPAVALFDASLAYAWGPTLWQLIARNLGDRHYERGGTTARPLARERRQVEAALQLRF